MEDCTQVVISYDMNTRVSFCLSYDHFKLDFITFKGDNCLTENT